MTWILAVGVLVACFFLFLIREDFKAVRKDLSQMAPNYDDEIKRQLGYVRFSLDQQREEIKSSTRDICDELNSILYEVKSVNRTLTDDNGLQEIVLYLKQLDTVQNVRLSNVESYLDDVLKILKEPQRDLGN